MAPMDKRQKRTQAKIASIKQAARELFAAHGVDKVSVDEIAAKANVSKVTLYKHFGSKDNLYIEVVNEFMNEALAATEEVFYSDMEFPDKLKFVFLTQANLSQLASYNYLFEVWEKDTRIAASMNENLAKVKALIYKFYEEGQRTGYIDESLSFELLYFYAEVFRAGLRAKSVDMESVLIDKDAVEQLINLYFFGIMKKR